ncbi:RTT109 [[Candida] subhashii]|uniref:histone acetyltransferase n=1 Tax=[Candida] subhashii TaxID=561895 RepID=A0A8J5QH68_9ASCO|nr:RTT109 [[Candida] subhashii]KAG7662053.1 RTT109 [[Candida] subhashii]
MTTNLLDKISNYLPANEKFRILYIQSKPVYVKSPINISKSVVNKPDTVKIRHFFTIISSSDIIVLGIEIFVYLQIYPDYIDQFIFVSKCDTVGFHKIEFKIGVIIEEFIQYLINYDLTNYKIKPRKEKYDEQEKEDIPLVSNDRQTQTTYLLNELIKKLASDPKYFSSIPYYQTNTVKSTVPVKPNLLRQLPSKQNIKVSLFTKAAPQYIFPNSAKNQHKHVINGQQLLKWWIPVINKCTSKWPIHRLMIPGSDKLSTSKFIQNFPNWSIGHIFGTKGPAVYSIALFPDDPKGRFLEHLIVENRYSNVNVEQFYEELGYRQEFRLGDLVGLIGCEIDDVPISSNQQEKENYSIQKLSIHQYKQFINLIKSENYNVEVDIKSLVETKIPSFFELNKLPFNYINVVGKMAKHAAQSRKQEPVVNTLTVKRKTNDLTGLVKRKKKS